MNNYANDYYNYVNNNYNLPSYNQNTFDSDYNKMALYDPYQGYIRGNLFPSLYNSYKINNPYDIKPMNEQAKMLTTLDMYGFAAHELNLYLDVYPDDYNAINLFNRYRGEANKLATEYQNKYGPLSINSNALNSTPWAWNNRPWPWENK